MESAAERCDSCGYCLSEADAVMGQGPVLAARIMDPGGVLSPDDMAEMQRCLELFEKTLPQMFFLVYLGSLPPRIPAAAFGFWLLNQAAVPELDAWRANERGLLLTVDTARGAAALSAGYFIEHHLSQRDLDVALRAGAQALAGGDHVAAVERVTGALIRQFAARSRALARAGAAPALPPAPLPETAPDFQPLPRLDESVPAVPAWEGIPDDLSPAWEPPDAPPTGAEEEEDWESLPFAEEEEEDEETEPVSEEEPVEETGEPESVEPAPEAAPAKKRRKREIPADPAPQDQEEPGLTAPTPKQDAESVADQVKKRAKAKKPSIPPPPWINWPCFFFWRWRRKRRAKPCPPRRRTLRWKIPPLFSTGGAALEKEDDGADAVGEVIPWSKDLLILPEWPAGDSADPPSPGPAHPDSILFPPEIWERGPDAPPVVEETPNAAVPPEKEASVKDPEGVFAPWFSGPADQPLRDPAGLLRPDRLATGMDLTRRWLNEQCGFRTVVVLFPAETALPADFDPQEPHRRWFGEDGNNGLLLLYFYGQPERSLGIFSASARKSYGSEALRAALDAAVASANEAPPDSPEDQLELFLQGASISLYQMVREGPGAVSGSSPPATAGRSAGWAVFGVVSAGACAAGVWAFQKRRKKGPAAAPEVILLPDTDFVPRLGGPHCGGFSSSLSFARTSGARGKSAAGRS